jgi:hypothetical protein
MIGTAIGGPSMYLGLGRSRWPAVLPGIPSVIQ